MRLLQDSVGSNEAVSVLRPEVHGVTRWILGVFRVWRGHRETARKQLRLVEMLPLGGKRQLMLVTCAGESFLVGGGVDSIETIVRLNSETSLGILSTGLDGPCR
jgi:Flagellar biosynthesis protein, FliO